VRPRVVVSCDIALLSISLRGVVDNPVAPGA
jgi:hypothetical protein